MTVSQYFQSTFGEPLWQHVNEDALADLDIESECGQQCVETIDRYKAFMRECHDQLESVLNPLLQSLRSQLEVYYYG